MLNGQWLGRGLTGKSCACPAACPSSTPSTPRPRAKQSWDDEITQHPLGYLSCWTGWTRSGYSFFHRRPICSAFHICAGWSLLRTIAFKTKASSGAHEMTTYAEKLVTRGNKNVNKAWPENQGIATKKKCLLSQGITSLPGFKPETDKSFLPFWWKVKWVTHSLPERLILNPDPATTRTESAAHSLKLVSVG